MNDKRLLRIDDLISRLAEIKKDKGNILVTLISPAYENDWNTYPETYEGIVDDDVKVIYDNNIKNYVVGIDIEKAI